jgi:hypothetical protein
MKISFDSAILWLLPYLYLVSVAYYLGFWGTFDIDAINYYPVSDLVKGVTIPISMTSTIAAVLEITMAYVKYSAEKILRKSGALTLGSIMVVTFLVTTISFICRNNSIVDDVAKTTNMFRNIAGILLFVFVVITAKVESTFTPTSISKSTLRFSYLLFALYLPCQANIDGRINALVIHENEEFNYVKVDSIAAPKGIYKYLGKAGDYHFLLSTDNIKQVIMPSDKMNSLVIEHFSRKDRLSVARFAASMKLAATPSVIEKSPEQH